MDDGMSVFLDYTIELRQLSGVAADGFATGFRFAVCVGAKVGVAVDGRTVDRRTVFGRNWAAGFKAGREYLNDVRREEAAKCAR